MSSPQQRPDRTDDNKRIRVLLLGLIATAVAMTLLLVLFFTFVEQRRVPAPPDPAKPTALAANSPLSSPQPTRTPSAFSPESARQSLQTLNEADVPARNLYAIAARLRLKSLTPVPQTVQKPAGDYEVGHTDTFNVHEIAGKRYYTITARVELVTDNAYWYVQEGERIDRRALEEAATAFDDRIYPTNTRIFGTEWKPGVDNDPRITVLLADIPNLGGYFSSADEFTTAINQYSNQREMIYINTGAGWNDIESTLAHEHQHMIHWYGSRNHDVWLNEGAAVLASALNGYANVGVDESYMSETDTQLNAWNSTPNDSLQHYGAAYLFLEFLRSQYGGENLVRALVSAPGQGTKAVDNALAKLGYKDTFTDAFKQWTLANLVDGKAQAEEKKLDYPDREVEISVGARIASIPKEHKGSVAQFGADYIEVVPQSGEGSVEIEFRGAPEVQVIPARARSGSRMWWSNRGDVSNTHMTRRFDLTAVKAATLQFSAWYDIEEGFDYAYVEASTDGGATWDILKGEHTTTSNPNGTSFGNAYTGKSKDGEGADKDGWVRESIDLTPYAGKSIELRFEYITDDGYNANGFAVDDIEIPELGYRDDAESESDWQTAGFAPVYDRLPQEYGLTAVLFNDDNFEVRPIEVDETGMALFTLDGLGTDYESAVLVVSGTTLHTLQRADYVLEISRK